MATKSDREAMAAALGGMVSRPVSEPAPGLAPPERPPAPAQKPRKAKPKAKAPARRQAKPAARTAPPEAEAEGGGFQKTGIGYVKADGTAMVRTVVMVTEAERQRLKLMALEAGVSPSDYVRRALGFL